MDFQSVWFELAERLDKAERELAALEGKADIVQEKERLQGKLQGVKIAQAYMRELQTTVTKEDEAAHTGSQYLVHYIGPHDQYGWNCAATLEQIVKELEEAGYEVEEKLKIDSLIRF